MNAHPAIPPLQTASAFEAEVVRELAGLKGNGADHVGSGSKLSAELVLLEELKMEPIDWIWAGCLGACLLNPGEMGFEPLKPVGEPDAANSRIRFDVRVEALRPSFVAPFPRWRSSAGCECGKGRGPPLGELQDIVGEADEAPLVGDLLDAAQEKLTEAARLLDLSEHRLGQLLS